MFNPEKYLENYTLPNDEGVELGVVDITSTPKILIDFMNVWIDAIDKHIESEYKKLVNGAGNREYFNQIFSQRGISWSEYKQLFNPHSNGYAQTSYVYLKIKDKENLYSITSEYALSETDYCRLLISKELDCLSFFLEEIQMKVPRRLRQLHGYIVAKTRAGKSSLMKIFFRDDIKHKKKLEGLIYLDPHALTAKEIRRMKCIDLDDLIYLDPTIPGYTPVLNPFDHKGDDIELSTNTDYVYEAFVELMGEEFTPSMVSLLKFCVQAMLHIDNTTLLDMYNLIDALSRNTKKQDFSPKEHELIQKCKTVPYDITQHFFASGYKTVDARSYTGVLNRIRGMLGDVRVRNFLVGETSIDLDEIVNRGKIVVVNLDYITLKDGGEAIGRFLVSAILKTITRRSKLMAELPKHLVPSNKVYMDECQTLVSSKAEKALSEFGKFNVGLTLAHQYAEQMDTVMLKALLSNTYVKIVGQNSDTNASIMAGEMRVEKRSLSDLEKYHFRLNIDGKDKGEFVSTNYINHPRLYYTEKEAKERIDKVMIEKYYRKIKDTTTLEVDDWREGVLSEDDL